VDSFGMYLNLMKERPDLFRNTGEPGEIKIITDLQRIQTEQKRIQAELRAQGKPEHWIEIGVLTEDEWFWTIRDMVEFPDGHIWGYIRDINRKSQESNGFNVILMCVQDDRVLMIRRYRHEERNWSWEFPRGFGEPGISATKNAKIELKEEIGVSNAKLTCLTKVKEGKGGTAVFLAEIPQDQKITLEKGEGIANYMWIRMSKLEEIVRKGQLGDWFSLWAYTLAKASNVL
jgi:ADP-ribose pyrophosphatase